MKIEDLTDMWNIDSKIDISNIINEAVNTTNLHNKYFPIYIKEGLRLKSLKSQYKQLILLMTEYYRGELSSEDLKKNNLQPFNLKLLRSDINQYVEADQRVIDSTLKIGYQEGIVEFLESIIRQINNRGYVIKNIIDFKKFEAGG